MSMRPIKPDEFAELAWRVLFQKGQEAANPHARGIMDRRTWYYEDEELWIEDFETREFLTVRSSRHSEDMQVFLSKKGSLYDTFKPEHWVIDRLERILVLDTLANL